MPLITSSTKEVFSEATCKQIVTQKENPVINSTCSWVEPLNTKSITEIWYLWGNLSTSFSSITHPTPIYNGFPYNEQ